MKLILSIILLAAGAWAQSTVTVATTLTDATGIAFNGTVRVTLRYSAPLTTPTSSLAFTDRTYTVSAGALSVTLTPNASISPAGTAYEVRYQPNSGSAWWEYWVVPASPSTTTPGAVRSSIVPNPRFTIALSQITNSGATVGAMSFWNGTSWVPTSTTSATTGWVPTRQADGSVAFQANAASISASSPITFGGGVVGCATCVVTDGGYANPTWLSSLAHTKITGHTWPTYTSGAAAPEGACTAPAVYAETTSSPDVLYHCIGGAWAQIGGTGSATGESWGPTAVTLPAMESGRTGCNTMAATGVKVGEAVAVAPSALETGLRLFHPLVLANDVVTICAINDSLATVTPASHDFTIFTGAGGGGGDLTTVANSGDTGASVLKTGTNVTARKIIAGTNVTVTENTDDITIDASGAGLPSFTGAASRAVMVKSDETDVEYISQTPGAGMAKTRAGTQDVWSVDSSQVGYLALNNAWLGNNTFGGKVVTAPSATQTLSAGDAIAVSTVAVKQISAAGDVTLTGAPTIADGDDGQHVWLINVSAYTITLQDEATLPSTNLCMIADANLAIAPKAAVHLLFNSTAGCWIEVK